VPSTLNHLSHNLPSGRPQAGSSARAICAAAASQQAGSHQRNPAVGKAASANHPVSLRSPSCPVPVCNGNEVSGHLALGLDMRFRVPAMGVQQFRPRNPPAHQHHLPAAVKYTNLDTRKRERRMARREDGRATDAKQARMHGRTTAVCVESASPSPTHGEQPDGSVVQANPPSAFTRRTRGRGQDQRCAGLGCGLPHICF